MPGCDQRDGRRVSKTDAKVAGQSVTISTFQPISTEQKWDILV
jgi:hypothetical protein